MRVQAASGEADQFTRLVTRGITVEDNGPGVSPANRGRVFEPFFTASRDQGGTGLGLAIVRAMAQGVGGAVDLVPSEQGACFRVELPAGGSPGRRA